MTSVAAPSDNQRPCSFFEHSGLKTASFPIAPVTYRHEVSSQRDVAHERYAHQILSEIEAGHPLSQRTLSNRLGITLGMTNLLLRRLVRKGWVRVSRVQPNRIGYFLTPTGIAEKARMSRNYFQDSVRLYASARQRLGEQFALLSQEWPLAGDAASSAKRIVFLGSGEVAEIAYVCLQETDLLLTGVIDFQGRERFFGVPVFPALAVTAETSVVPDGALLVAFHDSEQVREWLRRTAFPLDRVYWL